MLIHRGASQKAGAGDVLYDDRFQMGDYTVYVVMPVADQAATLRDALQLYADSQVLLNALRVCDSPFFPVTSRDANLKYASVAIVRAYDILLYTYVAGWDFPTHGAWGAPVQPHVATHEEKANLSLELRQVMAAKLIEVMKLWLIML